ncbi:MAG: class I SAM-dependent methyltransferase [Thermoguttaceae bacterium]|nr:class I SAM-dependent methyltransferase [Thermoguttaceae bacterium]
MGLFRDLRILFHLTLKPVRGKDHAARLESFYAGQAAGYDNFRKRLLKGREELFQNIEIPDGTVWVDMGGGTGSNLELLGPRIGQLAKVYVVDLSPSLLKVANERAAGHGWKNVETVEADATTWQPPGEPADVVTFSYSLTMIPDWIGAVENGRAMLRDGGRLGAVDFYVSRKYPAEGMRRHGWLTRSFWPAWFSMDNVFPSPDHVPYLHRRFEPLHFAEHRGKMPYMPLARVPYYTFAGRKGQ